MGFLIILMLIFFTYLYLRIEIIFNFMISMIKLGKYEQLPTIDHMLFKFWVWPLDKFLPKE